MVFPWFFHVSFPICFYISPCRLQLVSRLDLPTSGVLPLARSRAAELLRAQFTAGLVEKAVKGRVPWGITQKHSDFHGIQLIEARNMGNFVG